MSKTKGPDIKWEDSDSDDGFGGVAVEDAETAAGDASDFAAMLEGRAEATSGFMIGERVKGVLTMIPDGPGDAHVDLAAKESGIMDRAELLDESGQLVCKVGDPIEAFVVARQDGDIVLSRKMMQSIKNLEDLQAARDRKVPVRGRVARVVKGGFEIMVLGRPAFCPLSQIDLRPVESAEAHVGRDYEFQVERIDERGRNIVLSRAALLRKQAEARVKELMASLRPDMVLDGTVSEVRDFGAFVDIGGVDGMVHISELGHGRVARAADAVNRGDRVRVKVLKIEHDAQGRPRIALSMKAAAKDPWEQIGDFVAAGRQMTGRVVKLMPFGAFVELRPGIEGLIHVSEMSWVKRVHHPSDVLREGDMVTVTVKDVDHAAKRISLTMKQVEEDPWFNVAARFPVGHVVTAPVEKLKSFGAIVALAPGLSGLVPVSVLRKKCGDAYKGASVPGKQLEVVVAAVDPAERKIRLSLTGIEEEDADRKDYLEYLQSETAAREEAVRQQREDTGRTGSFGALLAAKLSRK